ncbi:16934_t:CDS:1 [Cetraspora pellucida]|uniref:16934_t:CDS:1 n=1 Tax=Cetraspora pellucida TaxID=1433469 RepID=A0ACA9KYX5_9GLOM|nr:16934_t:CDS:1 [Cetraspora pellucida]
MKETQYLNELQQNKDVSTMDVVIPVAIKDKIKLQKCLQGILENSLTPINNVYIISNNENILKDLLNNNSTDVKIIFISEAHFPFSKEDIKRVLDWKKSEYNHATWYYQQLLKFYIFRVIPDLFENVLILDSDFIFKQKVGFMTNDGKAILAYGYPFKWILNTSKYPENVNHSHIDFAKRFVPMWKIINSFSGMHHHLLFQKHITESLFKYVETYHKKDFWKAFMDAVDIKKWNAASEYVIYFHFAVKNYPNDLELRHLNSYDFIYDSEENGNDILQILDQFAQYNEYKAVGFHSFLNLKERLKTMDYITESLQNKMLSEKYLCFILKLSNGMLEITNCSDFKKGII